MQKTVPGQRVGSFGIISCHPKLVFVHGSNSISKSIVSLLPTPCRATALSAASRLDTIDLEME